MTILFIHSIASIASHLFAFFPETFSSCTLAFCSSLYVDGSQSPFLLTAADETSQVNVYNLENNKKISTLKLDASEKSFGTCMCMAACDDSSSNSPSRILIGYEDGTIALWDIATRKMLCRRQIHSDAVTNLDFCTRKNVGVSGSVDKSLCRWSLQNGTISPPFKQEVTNPGIACLKFRPDGKLLVSGGWDGNLRIFNSRLKQLAILALHKGSVTSVDFSSDNTLVSSGKDSVIAFWNIYK